MPTLNWLKNRILSWWKDDPPVFLLVCLLAVLAPFWAIIFWRKDNPFVFWVVLLLVVLVTLFLFTFVSADPKWAFRRFGIKSKFPILKFLGSAIVTILLAIPFLPDRDPQVILENAKERIGHASSSVRLDAAYELFHLAEDTLELRRTVLDILCTHVRRTTSGVAYRKDYSTKPSEEIQRLLTLLFVRKHDVFRGFRINLAGSWLNGANLRNARLQDANLQGVWLQDADLMNAQLQDADLMDAQLQRAFLMNAQLQRASLMNAQLQGASFMNAQLQGASFENAQLQGARDGQ